MRTTLTEQQKKQFEYLIKLLSSAVNRTPAPVPYEGTIWQNILKLAQRCSVTAMATDIIMSLPPQYLPPDSMLDEIKKLNAKELLIDGNLDYETEVLLRTFEKYKVKNLPLKGYFMKKEYSRSDYRAVSDVDILFDESQKSEMNSAFEELGYTFVHEDDLQVHYKKAPCMYVEMHKGVAKPSDFYYDFIKNQINEGVKREDYSYSYRMSIEDYYLFMLLHNSTHFRIGGMGIRMMVDTYLFYKNHSAEFNFEYLNKRIAQFKLTKYEKRIRQIAFNWFSSPKPIITFDDTETYILLSGTLGRRDVGVMISSHNMRKTGKSKSKYAYLISSVFPHKSSMQTEYKYLEKAPFLLPVSWVQMWFKRFCIDKNVSVKQGVKNRLSYTDEDIACFNKIMLDTGLENYND